MKIPEESRRTTASKIATNVWNSPDKDGNRHRVLSIPSPSTPITLHTPPAHEHPLIDRDNKTFDFQEGLDERVAVQNSKGMTGRLIKDTATSLHSTNNELQNSSQVKKDGDPNEAKIKIIKSCIYNKNQEAKVGNTNLKANRPRKGRLPQKFKDFVVTID